MEQCESTNPMSGYELKKNTATKMIDLLHSLYHIQTDRDTRLWP